MSRGIKIDPDLVLVFRTNDLLLSETVITLFDMFLLLIGHRRDDAVHTQMIWHLVLSIHGRHAMSKWEFFQPLVVSIFSWLLQLFASLHKIRAASNLLDDDHSTGKDVTGETCLQSGYAQTSLQKLVRDCEAAVIALDDGLRTLQGACSSG